MTDKAVLGELGQRIERIRLDRNQTQEQLAREAGISRQVLWRLESGRDVRLPALIRVLRALDMLDGLERLVPEPAPSPIALLDRRGRQRQRARPRKAERGGAQAPQGRGRDERGRAVDAGEGTQPDDLRADSTGGIA